MVGALPAFPLLLRKRGDCSGDHSGVPVPSRGALLLPRSALTLPPVFQPVSFPRTRNRTGSSASIMTSGGVTLLLLRNSYSLPPYSLSALTSWNIEYSEITLSGSPL